MWRDSNLQRSLAEPTGARDDSTVSVFVTPASEFSCRLAGLMKRVFRVTQLVKWAASDVEGRDLDWGPCRAGSVWAASVPRGEPRGGWWGIGTLESNSLLFYLQDALCYLVLGKCMCCFLGESWFTAIFIRSGFRLVVNLCAAVWLKWLTLVSVTVQLVSLSLFNLSLYAKWLKRLVTVLLSHLLSFRLGFPGWRPQNGYLRMHHGCEVCRKLTLIDVSCRSALPVPLCPTLPPLLCNWPQSSSFSFLLFFFLCEFQTRMRRPINSLIQPLSRGTKR